MSGNYFLRVHVSALVLRHEEGGERLSTVGSWVWSAVQRQLSCHFRQTEETRIVGYRAWVTGGRGHCRAIIYRELTLGQAQF